MAIFENLNIWLLLAVGAVLIVLGALRFQIHRRRMIGIQLVPLGEAKGFVEVKGVVSVGREGVVQSPFSDRPAVWLRITVDAESGPEGARWRSMYQEITAKDFVLREPGGASLRVLPAKAEVRTAAKQTVLVGPTEEAPPKLVAYLVSQGGTLQDLRDFMGRPGSVRVIEEIIPLGDEVYVAGTAARARANSAKSAKPEGDELQMKGSPLYVAHQEIAGLARSGKLWDGRARE